MAASHSIEGLVKWSQREEWRDDLDAVIERHIGPACRGAEIEVHELTEIIGPDSMMPLWGCAFEDLVSSRRGEHNVADDYLKRRGWKESAGTRAYIAALRRSTMSLYEISDIVVGESFLARDLVRGGEPVRVFERSATRSLSQWDRIAARVVTVLGKTQITGAVLAFSHPLAEDVLAMLERVRKKTQAQAVEFARSLDRDVSSSEFAPLTDVEEVLAASAFMFTNVWLRDTLDRMLNPRAPKLHNTDGEPLEFITVHFPLLSRAKLQAVSVALEGLACLRKGSDTFWNWLDTEAPTRTPSKRKPEKQIFRTSMADGSLVLGAVELSEREVTLSVNSEARAARGRALLEPLLVGLVRAPLIERQTIDQMMSAGRDRAPEHDVRLPPDQERRIVHQGLTDHYRRTLDEPIPALGNQSPRRAAKTTKGRQKVIAWLKMLENLSAQCKSDDPMASYDFSWIWEELGLAEARN
jgi:hypothetical protein